MAESFGIPYARSEVGHGRLYRICPICRVRIEETAGQDGEQTTNNYASHYERLHASETPEERRTRLLWYQDAKP